MSEALDLRAPLGFSLLGLLQSHCSVWLHLRSYLLLWTASLLLLQQGGCLWGGSLVHGSGSCRLTVSRVLLFLKGL